MQLQRWFSISDFIGGGDAKKRAIFDNGEVLRQIEEVQDFVNHVAAHHSRTLGA